MRRRSGLVVRAFWLVTALFFTWIPVAATWAEGFRVSSLPREIVLFVGVTSLEESRTRSLTVYGDGTALLHLDTEKETLEKIVVMLERAELEAILKVAVDHELTRWDADGLGRRAEALGQQVVGAESKMRTRLLLAFESLRREGVSERAVTRTVVLHDSRALREAFPQIDEYAAVVQIEDWMESLWRRPPLQGAVLPTDGSTTAVPTGSDELVLRAESGPGMALRKSKVEFFGDGGVLFESRTLRGELLERRTGKLGAAELAEFQKLARRLAVFDPRSIAVQIFRLSGKNGPMHVSDSSPQTFEVHLKRADGSDLIRRFEYTGEVSVGRPSSIQELADIRQIWLLAKNAHIEAPLASKP